MELCILPVQFKIEGEEDGLGVSDLEENRRRRCVLGAHRRRRRSEFRLENSLTLRGDKCSKKVHRRTGSRLIMIINHLIK